jgi:hypothetical protein
MKVLDCGVVLLSSVLLATAGNRNGPTAPIPDQERSVSLSPGPPAPVPSSPRQPVAFELTGVVTDGNGKPLSGAKITVDFLVSDVGETTSNQNVIFASFSATCACSATGTWATNA